MTGRRILVIEDNPTNLELLMFLLRASGYTPYAARDGLAGLQLAVELLPDLIICDIQLPTIDGYEVARRIRAHDQLRRLTVIAVTACAMPADRERALAAGFDGYIAKPIMPYTFCDEVARFLNDDVDEESQSIDMPDEPDLLGGDGAVLVAEHLPVNLDVLTAVLKPGGRSLVVARCVTEALTLLKQRRFSLLLVELDLPGGGAELLLQRASSGNWRTACPSLVLVPGGASESAKAPFRRAEDCELMHWPIDPADLLDWINAHEPALTQREGATS